MMWNLFVVVRFLGLRIVSDVFLLSISYQELPFKEKENPTTYIEKRYLLVPATRLCRGPLMDVKIQG
jgi:hypothetical protein